MFDDFIKAGLIEPEELLPLLDHPDVKLVDASYVLPGQDDDRLDRFGESRIGNAVFFDIDAIADQNTDLPHMLPTPEEFAHAVSGLGISNKDLVVVYGQSGLIMGPARVWSTFRIFGHDKVCVLNGGLPAWNAAGAPLNDSPYIPPTAEEFAATLQENLVSALPQTQAASENSSALILDARPPGRFDGHESEPRPGLNKGHIPNSHNIPAGFLIDETTQKLKSSDELQKIFADFDLSPDSPIITTCGSGVTAAVIALALYHIGFAQASIYDGSWAEWGKPDLNLKLKTN